ncbi:MAG TPA: DHA2 family efflux MFS transporter permease subunit [Trebonia sp.]
MSAVVAERTRSSVIVQYGLLAGPLLSMLDSSIVNVAIVPITRGLHTSLGTAQWTVSGYLLALGTGLAGTAYLARRSGTLPVYRFSLIAFTLASAACALAPDAGTLVAARIVQGLVAAPLVPLAMSIMLGRGGSAGSMSPVAGILLFAGPALGPAVGGALIGAAGWRLIFLINVPLGALAAAAAWKLPGKNGHGRSVKFDLSGLVVLAGGLGVLLYGTTDGASHGWSRAWPLVACGAVLLAGYGWHAARRESPALDVTLARAPVPALSMGLCAMASVVAWAAIFLLPVFVQGVQGRSALAAGIAMAPQGIVTGISTALGGKVLVRFTVRTTVITGFVVLAVASLGILAIGARTPLWVVAAILAVRSVSIGLVITPLLTALTAPLPPELMADASTLFNVAQRIAGSFGIGLIAALYGDLARSSGAVTALHTTGLVIASIAAAGATLAVALPAVRNVARSAPAR